MERNVIVCVKQVPDVAEVKINPETGTLIREGVPSIINPFDTYAIEEALLLREKFGGRVTVVSMGPPQAEDALREIVHKYDGVIHRELYNRGEIVRRYDLNADGRAIRRLFYREGRLARREFHNRDGIHTSTEHFNAGGWIAESL